MTDLRVVEVYVSYQGEGPNTGKPTVFVRFAGCNFKCPGWPCDTQHAIQPKLFRGLQRFVDPGTLANEVAALGVANICLTGGEVFLQNAEALHDFVRRLKMAYRNVECFTNGGLRWGTETARLIDNFIVDWKLPGSGEEYEPTDVLSDNLHRLGEYDAIKFTIKNRADYEEAKRRWARLVGHYDTYTPAVYCGVVWDKLQTEELCKWMIQDRLSWNLNVQVHKFIWHPDKQGV
jgi:7-carboxy-7-deazaguanine synthase